MTFPGYNLRVGVVQYCATDSKSWYGLQVRGFGEDSGLQFEWQPQYGFAARPVDATSGTGCNAVYSIEGQFSWCIHDQRYNDKAPPLTPGSAAQWNYKGAFSLFDCDTETWTVYVPMNNATKAHTVVAGKDANGKEYIELRHANGSYVVLNDDGVVVRHTGDAYVEVNGGKVNLNGEVNTTASLNVGGAAAQPLVNGTAFQAALGAVATALNALTPLTPYEIGLQAALLGLVSAFDLCKTQYIKGL